MSKTEPIPNRVARDFGQGGGKRKSGKGKFKPNSEPGPNADLPRLRVVALTSRGLCLYRGWIYYPSIDALPLHAFFVPAFVLSQSVSVAAPDSSAFCAISAASFQPRKMAVAHVLSIFRDKQRLADVGILARYHLHSV